MSEELQLVDSPSGALAKQTGGKPLDMEMLFRAAMEKGPEIVERMMAVRRELNAEQAKAAFDSAMRGFQAECPTITKTRGVLTNAGKLAYRYAPFESILQIVRPALDKFGFTFSLDTDTASESGWVIAKCEVAHTAGHSKVSTAKFPLGAGTQMMSTTQIYAAALTFASRRVFCNAFGIVTAGEDADGGGSEKPKPRGPADAPVESPNPQREALKRVWELLAPVRGTEKNWFAANLWLVNHKIITGEKRLADMTIEELTEVWNKASIVMEEGQ